MTKLRQKSSEASENIVEILCEQYLPAVLRYVNCWVNNTELAEELTLSAIKKALARYRCSSREDNVFAIKVFAAARKEVQSHLRISSFKPVLHVLSNQEQEVYSLKFGAGLDNRRISKILGLSESTIGRIFYESLCKMNGCMKVSK